MPIKKLLIANRGEIAVRIIRAARDLGIATVQVMSAADRDMLAVRLADEAIEIGPRAGGQVLSQRRSDPVGSDCLRGRRDPPRLRFSVGERLPSPRRSRRAGLIFVGPRAQTIRQMGDKAIARNGGGAGGRADGAGQRGTGRRPRRGARAGQRHWVPDHDQGRGGRRRSRHPRRAHSPRRTGKTDPLASAEAARGFRRRRVVSRTLHRAGAPRRGADSRRRRAGDSRLRARMLDTTAPPEGVGGGAGGLPRRRRPRTALRLGRRPCALGRLPRRRHARIPLRRGDARNSFSSR